jgi:hypothetical protein
LNHVNAEAQDAPDIVLGTFHVNYIPATVLFYSGAHSFITKPFVRKSGLKPSLLSSPMIVQIPGSTTRTNLVCRAVPIEIQEVWFYANLIVLGEQSLEVILGMNWMSKHKGHIDCERKAIRITSSEDVEVEYVSTLPSSMVLCNKSIVEPSLKQVPVVKEYPGVFLEELPGMPLIGISSCRAG